MLLFVGTYYINLRKKLEMGSATEGNHLTYFLKIVA